MLQNAAAIGHCFLAAFTSVVAAQSLPATPPEFVVRGDGVRASFGTDPVPDRIVLDPAWSLDEFVFGRVLLEDGAQAVAPRAVVGLESGDLFGLAVCSIGDVDGDGIEDVAVAAPGAGPKTDLEWGLRTTQPGQIESTYGRVCLISGATGAGLGVLQGLPGEMFGWGVARVIDVDGDGRDEVLVRSFVADVPNSTARGVGRYTVVSSMTGAPLDFGLESELVLSLRITDLHALWNAKRVNSIRLGLAADLNADGVVGAADLVEQLGNLGQSGSDVDRGDVDASDSIDPLDVTITVSSMGQGASANSPSPRPAQMKPCIRNQSANCFICIVGSPCPGDLEEEPGGGDDGGDGGPPLPPEACPGCGPPCPTCCPTCPCPTCPPGGCPPPDVNCNGQPDPPECNVFNKLDARTDSNNDNTINESDDAEDRGLGRVMIIHNELLDAPRDIGTILIVQSPPDMTRWRIDCDGMKLGRV